MILKKISLSLIVAAASGAYVWSLSGEHATDDLLGLAPGVDVVTTRGIEPQGVKPPSSPPILDAGPAPFAPRQTDAGNTAAPSKLSVAPPPVPPQPPAIAEPPISPIAGVAPLARNDVPLPRRRPAHQVPAMVRDRIRPEPPAREVAMRVAMNVGSNAGYADGIYTGPVTDAYYGPIQIQAIIQGGRLVGIKVLQYPSDRQTSVFINRQALPILRDEVVSAQSAKVDIVSGATLTSEAFIRSLDSALRKARA